MNEYIEPAQARRKTTTATKKRIMGTDDESEARYEQEVRNTERRGVWTNDIPGLSHAFVDVNDDSIAVARNAHDEEDLDDVDGASLDNGSEQRESTASSGASQPTAPAYLHQLAPVPAPVPQPPEAMVFLNAM